MPSRSSPHGAGPRPREGPSAKFFVVGVHRDSTVSCSARVIAAILRQCRSSGRRDERPFRRAPTAAVESDCTTMRQRRVAEERTAQRTASTVAPSSLSLICAARAGPRRRRRTATRQAAGSSGASKAVDHARYTSQWLSGSRGSDRGRMHSRRSSRCGMSRV